MVDGDGVLWTVGISMRSGEWSGGFVADTEQLQFRDMYAVTEAATPHFERIRGNHVCRSVHPIHHFHTDL